MLYVHFNRRCKVLDSEEILEKYHELLNVHTVSMVGKGTMDQMIACVVEKSMIEALGWVLEKSVKEMAIDMEDAVYFTHRENPTVIAVWNKSREMARRMDQDAA